MSAIEKKKYYPQHMHVHSIYEPGSSMEGHIYFASLLGMKYIWFTEHDIFWDKKPYSFGFEPEETEPDGLGRPTKVFLPSSDSVGEVKTDTDMPYDGKASLRLTADKNPGETWRGASAVTFGAGISQSLCRLPMLSLAHRGVAHSAGDVRYIFDITLSERPPEQKFAHIIFVAGDSEGLSAPHTLVLPISVGEAWELTTFDISLIASSADAIEASIGGLDNVISALTVRVETRRGASASLFIDSLEVSGKSTAEETKKRQTELALEIGKRYGVTPFVTAEITAGGHKNCFSTNPPIFTYGNPAHKVSNAEACAVMSERGQVFSINHPFVYLSDENPVTVDYDAECDSLVEKLAESGAYGASLLEVGFPFGRYAPLSAHLRLWDKLALRGVLLTGYGATDSHMMTEGWFSGNNFANFIGVNTNSEPTEDDFAASMRAGMLYAANPLVIKGEVSFVADGCREMGSLSVLPRGASSRVAFSLGISNHNWKVAWIVNGERVRLDDATRMGYYGEYELTTSGDVDFIRTEVYDYFGNLLLMTNPIYFTADVKNIKNGAKGRTVHK